ncbi:hypothetical protein CKA32_001279 [Geitlerinema sp. FC II]|nr:hypothetical protein [Geitlerinema sp. CS-897]PPT09332.1 hypothetical protein CKA32_001279 [Geitlerinema sp. FC II]
MLAIHATVEPVQTNDRPATPDSSRWDRILSWILGSDELLEIAREGLPESKRVRQLVAG